MSRKTGQNNSRNTQKAQKKKNGKGHRFTLSARAQAVLKTILQDLMEETLNDAKKIAEQAGKGRVSLEEVEKALKKLCARYNPQSDKSQKEVAKVNRKSK